MSEYTDANNTRQTLPKPWVPWCCQTACLQILELAGVAATVGGHIKELSSRLVHREVLNLHRAASAAHHLNYRRHAWHLTYVCVCVCVRVEQDICQSVSTSVLEGTHE